MAVFERTFDEAMAQVEALTMGGFSDTDEVRLGKIFNLAATRAKRKCDYWERLLIVDEPRTVARGILQTSEDSFNVYGAGTDAANGLYVRNGVSADGNPAYTLFDSDGTTALYNMWSESNFAWGIGTGAIDSAVPATYGITSSSTTPPTSGWASGTGEDPAPLLKDVDDIETALYYRKDSSLFRSSRTYEFAADGYGIRPSALGEENTTVFVTYIKKLTDVYGNGGGEVSSIPAEWFDYMTLYAAYMYQSSQRQNNPNAAYGMALREVDSSLEDEMVRLETQGIPQTVRQNVETRIAYSSIS